MKFDTLIISFPGPVRIMHEAIAPEDCEPEVDTGEFDGGGEFSVRASPTVEMVTARSVRFHHVEVETTDDYAEWDRDSVMHQAAVMLARDYIEAKDGSGEVAVFSVIPG
jgi:hypothetical protein